MNLGEHMRAHDCIGWVIFLRICFDSTWRHLGGHVSRCRVIEWLQLMILARSLTRCQVALPTSHLTWSPGLSKYLTCTFHVQIASTSTFKGVIAMEAPTLLRDLHWTPLEGPGTVLHAYSCQPLVADSHQQLFQTGKASEVHQVRGRVFPSEIPPNLGQW